MCADRVTSSKIQTRTLDTDEGKDFAAIAFSGELAGPKPTANAD